MITEQEYNVLRRYDDLLNDWKCGKCVTVNRLAWQELQPIAHKYFHKTYSMLCRGCILHLMQDCYNLREAYSVANSEPSVPKRGRRSTKVVNPSNNA